MKYLHHNEYLVHLNKQTKTVHFLSENLNLKIKQLSDADNRKLGDIKVRATILFNCVINSNSIVRAVALHFYLNLTCAGPGGMRAPDKSILFTRPCVVKGIAVQSL